MPLLPRPDTRICLYEPSGPMSDSNPGSIGSHCPGSYPRNCLFVRPTSSCRRLHYSSATRFLFHNCRPACRSFRNWNHVPDFQIHDPICCSSSSRNRSSYHLYSSACLVPLGIIFPPVIGSGNNESYNHRAVRTNFLDFGNL